MIAAYRVEYTQTDWKGADAILPGVDVVQRIRDLCAAYSWTYYRLAKESGVTYSTLNAMMKKGTVPSVSTLEKLCGGFGISLSQFFAEDKAAAALTESQKQHLRDWSALSDENKACAEKFIQFLRERQNG